MLIPAQNRIPFRLGKRRLKSHNRMDPTGLKSDGVRTPWAGQKSDAFCFCATSGYAIFLSATDVTIDVIAALSRRRQLRFDGLLRLLD